ncbi:hypothetical protein PBY51_014920 [Eleginops maclovinus]|uniref:Uncharacterized protein n=1 Tax=Eleginops maclovinus TaxID=56733 RepID=A0AAN7X4D8_ELEMC|nr:hypothetical protein PBY51_014920 [Eleginops maclovinus]
MEVLNSKAQSGSTRGAILLEFTRRISGHFLQSDLNTETFSCGLEVTACYSELEHRDAAVSVFQWKRDTCCEAWLSTAEERGGWEMNCDSGLAHEGRDRIQQLVQCPPAPTPSQPPALSLLPPLKQAMAPDRWKGRSDGVCPERLAQNS